MPQIFGPFLGFEVKLKKLVGFLSKFDLVLNPGTWIITIVETKIFIANNVRILSVVRYSELVVSKSVFVSNFTVTKNIGREDSSAQYVRTRALVAI